MDYSTNTITQPTQPIILVGTAKVNPPIYNGAVTL